LDGAGLAGGGEQVVGAVDVYVGEELGVDDHGVGAREVEDGAGLGFLEDRVNRCGGGDVTVVVVHIGVGDTVAGGVDVEDVDLAVGFLGE
jgi:hypothetical protein